MSYRNLEEALQSVRSPVELLRNSQIGPYAFPVVPSEYTNWRDEQRSWRETCALFDQSHHMTDLYLEGPDALKLISSMTLFRHVARALSSADPLPEFAAMADHADAILAAAMAQGYSPCAYTEDWLRGPRP